VKDIKAEHLEELFIEKYGESSETSYKYFSPGRINLIGEYTDFNGGYVFPCALDFGTYAVVRKRVDEKVYFTSLNMTLEKEIDLSNISYSKKDDWMNYPKGVIKAFQDMGFSIGGFDVLYYGNIPNGAGLSSSASLEVLTAVYLNDLYNCGKDMIEMVKIAQKVENEFVGVNCGIMDQFAVAMGKKDHAILLNCDTLDYEYAPIQLDGYKIVIGNTMKRRGLTDSKYNERRAECDRALSVLQNYTEIDYLCDLDVRTFDKYKNHIESVNDRNRAEHVIYENDRVLKAVQALKDNDLVSFGSLVSQSHDSLRDYFNVTGLELDTLVAEAHKIEGVLGSRMTGAGFGGCTISIVPDSKIEYFIEEVGRVYEGKIGLKAEFYVAEIGTGARLLEK